MTIKKMIRGRSVVPSVAKPIILFCLLGLAPASAASVFNISGSLADGSSFSGSLTIDTVTVNSDTAVSVANITITGPSAQTCSGPFAQGHSGTFGYDVDLSCSVAANFDLVLTTPASVSGYVTGYTGGPLNFSAPTDSYLNGPPPVVVTAGMVTPFTAPTFSKAFDQAQIFAGSISTLTFTIFNSNAAGLTGVAFTDTFPIGLLVATPNGLSNTCGGSITADPGSTSVSLSGGSVAPSGTCAIHVSVTGISPGTQTNVTSTLTSNAPAASAATASILVIPAFDGSFQTGYAANASAGESYVNIINTGANGDSLLGPGLNGVAGNTCVNVYAFDPGEELISCCSCLVTPNQAVNLGVNENLTIKTLTPVIPTSVTIKLLNTLAGAAGTSMSCTNSAAMAGGSDFPIVNGMIAYGTTPQPIGNKYNVVEHPFIPSALSAAELASITNRCAFVIGNGGGYGICRTCQLGALGAIKM